MLGVALKAKLIWTVSDLINMLDGWTVSLVWSVTLTVLRSKVKAEITTVFTHSTVQLFLALTVHFVPVGTLLLLLIPIIFKLRTV